MDEVTSVSGTNNQDVRVPGTGFGDCLDLMAPSATGSTEWGITTTDDVGAAGYNDVQRDATCPVVALSDLAYSACFGGTSAAAPIVSGVAALVLSVNTNLTRQQVQNILTETADKVNCAAVVYVPPCSPANPASFNPEYGFGRVNAARAVATTAETFGKDPPRTLVVQPATFEIGFRMGVTWLAGTTSDQTVTNAPGGGPAGEPALYVAWLSGGAAHWMVEGQLGLSFESATNPSSHDSNLVAAVQPAYLFSLGAGQLFAGFNVAVQYFDSPSTSFTEWGGGGAVGYRYRPVPQLALRVEARHRQWTGGRPSETGISLGLGVVIP
jgi:hypothetical protein